MNIRNLIKTAELFEKMAQIAPKKVVDPQTKKQIDLWSNTLFAGVRGTANFLYSPGAARKAFDSIAAYHKSPATADSQAFKTVETLLTAISYSEDKLKGLGLDPIAVLAQKGMQNLHAGSLEILKTNLITLRDAENFANYRHYYLVSPGTPKEVIELDEPVADPKDSGY